MSRGLFVTFYSYRGGVGRSLALANVATILARKHRVVVCDLDLEAPGIEHYLLDANAALSCRPQRGFMDLIDEFRAAVSAGPAMDNKAMTREFRGTRVPRPTAFLQSAGRNLSLLTAGARRDDAMSEFARNVRRFDWNEFYEQWGGDAFVDLLHDDLGGAADFVLVDSRTGNTEIGGLATHDLADIVVLLTGTTPSNLEDSVRVAEMLRSERLRAARGGRPLHLLPVASRVEENAEKDDYVDFLRRFEAASLRLVDAGETVASEFLRQTCIPYVPYYAFAGRLCAREAEADRHPKMYAAYAHLTQAIEDLAQRQRRASAVTARGGGRVFLSYRHEDASATAAFLREELGRMLGDDALVFQDVRDVEAGASWPQTLAREIESAAAVVVVIGRNWLRAADEFGRRRIDSPDDWCRREVEVALRRGVPIVPVLVDGMQMPPAHALPESIAALHTRQSVVFGEDRRATLASLATTLGRHLGVQPTLSVSPASDDVLAAYRVYLRRTHANLVSFFSRADRLLDEVFVELQLAEVQQDAESAPGEPARGGAMGRGRDAMRACSLRELMALPSPADAAPSWLVIGEPGAGKSTLARHLAFSLADDPDGPVVIYALLAVLVARGAGHVFAQAEAALRRGEGDRAGAGLQERLFELAKAGQVWLLLDGLDEVAPDQRQETLALVQSLRASLPHVRLAVFSRPFGELGAPFRTAQILPLDRSARQRLLSFWLGDSAAADLSERLQTLPQLASLVANPLMLTLVARLSVDKVELPRHRVALYDRAVDLLLRSPYGRQGQTVRAPIEARHILGQLALHLQRSAGVAWSLPELNDVLWQVRNGDSRSEGALGKIWGGDSEVFLRELADRSGILGPYDGAEAPWRFLHGQLREFLAGEAMAGSNQPWHAFVGELDDDSIARWAETLGLYCALVKEPMAVLTDLRQRSAPAAVRALASIYAVSIESLLEFLWTTDTDEAEPQPTWTGDDLRAMAHAWVQAGMTSAAALTQMLWARVSPEVSVVRLAWLHFALSELGAVDRATFFAKCRRPIARAPSIAWVEIRAGDFVMGSPEDEPERLDREGPQHRVAVPTFGLMRTTVTNAQYATFDPAHEPRTWKGVSAKELANHPVVNVSWWHAYLFCAWLGARLPSEAEWEYACRAGTSTPFSFGKNVTTERVNYDGTPYDGGKKGKDRQRTVAVGSLPENAFGLHEMHGNVWEWCTDRWHDNYEGAPSDGSAWIEGGDRARVVRGGSWGAGAWGCRSAYRAGRLPSERDSSLGFRPARFTTD